MKQFFYKVCSFVKAHKVVTIAVSAAVVLGVTAGAILIAHNHRTTPPQKDPAAIVDSDHEHTYTSEEIPATCSHGSYTLFTCECGDFYKENETSPLEHEYGEWTIIQPATVDNDGQKEQRCLHCNDRKVESIPKIEEHDHVYESNVVSATCTEKGYTTQTCTICGFKTTDDETPALGHSWGSWKVTKEATASSTGEKKRSCQTCGKAETEVIPKAANSNHTHSYASTVVEATCSAGGYTKHTCSCGHSYEDNTVPAIGHLYGDWKTTVTPTTEKVGEKQCVCTRCGNVLTENIPAVEQPSDNSQAGHIDPRIEITSNGDGATMYYYLSVCVIDTRTWGSRPSISITAANGFQISYFKADGSKVNVSLLPLDGYTTGCVIFEDGSYTTSLMGDYSS